MYSDFPTRAWDFLVEERVEIHQIGNNDENHPAGV
jgi:hypothetical protein